MARTPGEGHEQPLGATSAMRALARVAYHRHREEARAYAGPPPSPRPDQPRADIVPLGALSAGRAGPWCRVERKRSPRPWSSSPSPATRAADFRGPPGTRAEGFGRDAFWLIATARPRAAAPASAEIGGTTGRGTPAQSSWDGSRQPAAPAGAQVRPPVRGTPGRPPRRRGPRAGRPRPAAATGPGCSRACSRRPAGRP